MKEEEITLETEILGSEKILRARGPKLQDLASVTLSEDFDTNCIYVDNAWSDKTSRGSIAHFRKLQRYLFTKAYDENKLISANVHNNNLGRYLNTLNQRGYIKIVNLDFYAIEGEDDYSEEEELVGGYKFRVIKDPREWL